MVCFDAEVGRSVLCEDGRREGAKEFTVFHCLVELIPHLRVPWVRQNAARPQCPCPEFHSSLKPPDYGPLLKMTGDDICESRRLDKRQSRRLQLVSDFLIRISRA